MGPGRRKVGKREAAERLRRVAERVWTRMRLGEAYTRESARDCEWQFSIKQGREYPASPVTWRAARNARGEDLVLLASDVERMIGGRDRAMLRKISRAIFVALDLDEHEAAPPWWPGSEEGWRLWRLRAAVEVAMALVPGGAVLAERTPRGFHLTVILRRVLGVQRAADLAAAWAGATRAVLAANGDRVPPIESFPKVGADGLGRTCALPLSRGHRVVSPSDLSRPAYRTRLLDAAVLLELPSVEPAALEAALAALPKAGEEGASGRPDAPEDCGRGVAPFQKAGFVLEALRLLDEGMADDESWHAARIFLGACRYGALGEDDAMRAWRVYVARSDHRATHCQTERGRRELLRIGRHQLRHFRRGMTRARSDGRARTWVGGMKADELRRALWRLADRRPDFHVRQRPSVLEDRDLDAAAE